MLYEVITASNIAIKTHQEQKISYLQSAIKNSVLLADYEETQKLIFIQAIDDLLPLHFNILFFLSNPSEYLTDTDRFHEEKDGLTITRITSYNVCYTKLLRSKEAFAAIPVRLGGETVRCTPAGEAGS